MPNTRSLPKSTSLEPSENELWARAQAQTSGGQLSDDGLVHAPVQARTAPVDAALPIAQQAIETQRAVADFSAAPNDPAALGGLPLHTNMPRLTADTAEAGGLSAIVRRMLAQSPNAAPSAAPTFLAAAADSVAPAKSSALGDTSADWVHGPFASGGASSALAGAADNLAQAMAGFDSDRKRVTSYSREERLIPPDTMMAPPTI